jgi:hypothetical protein
MSSIASTSWDRDSVRQALCRYAELCELYRAAFVVSSWPQELRTGAGPRAWPARFGLLSSKWDLDMAVRRLCPFDQALFHLRYRLGYSQERIGRILGCSRYWVWQLLDRMPSVLLQALCDEPVSRRRRSGRLATGGSDRLAPAGLPEPCRSPDRLSALAGQRRSGRLRVGLPRV